jgi:hypothetical protein
VFCLVKNAGMWVSLPADDFPWVTRDDGNGVNAILLGQSKERRSGCKPVLTCDFRVITDPHAILNYIAKTIGSQATSKPTESRVLEVPFNTAVHKRLYSRSAVYLTVPVETKLAQSGATEPDVAIRQLSGSIQLLSAVTILAVFLACLVGSRLVRLRPDVKE